MKFVKVLVAGLVVAMSHSVFADKIQGGITAIKLKQNGKVFFEIGMSDFDKPTCKNTNRYSLDINQPVEMQMYQTLVQAYSQAQMVTVFIDGNEPCGKRDNTLSVKAIQIGKSEFDD